MSKDRLGGRAALAGSFDVPDLCKGEQSAGAPRRHGERLVPYRPIATFHEGILDLPGSIWSFGETGCQEAGLIHMVTYY